MFWNFSLSVWKCEVYQKIVDFLGDISEIKEVKGNSFSSDQSFKIIQVWIKFLQLKNYFQSSGLSKCWIVLNIILQILICNKESIYQSFENL